MAQEIVKPEEQKKERNTKNIRYPKKYNQDNQPRRDTPFISVVIPLLNEEESLPELALQLENELKKISHNRYEVIFVDDGSNDSSYSVIKSINQRNRRFKGIRFRRNYGKSAALSAGFNSAQGMIIITMDADLQDDPAEIPNLVKKIKEGYDLVSGWKKKRRDPITKTIPSRFFNFITSVTSGVRLHDFNCGLKAYKRAVVKNLQVYGEMHRYLPALAHWQGFKVTEIPVTHHARRYGKTKFGMTRFIKGFLDLLTVLFTTRYFKRPLHFFGTIGTIVGLTGFGIDLWLTIEWFMRKTSLSNRPLALLGVALIIVGVQLVSMGLLGEMITKNSLEKSNYQISERI
ncbi:MAG: glycosyltransferase family 2 protein [Ignavibacteriae bacterium]|nr:glycosyltransferase family 2 protein [Ignavibacteriota bacterium]